MKRSTEPLCTSTTDVLDEDSACYTQSEKKQKTTEQGKCHFGFDEDDWNLSSDDDWKLEELKQIGITDDLQDVCAEWNESDEDFLPYQARIRNAVSSLEQRDENRLVLCDEQKECLYELLELHYSRSKDNQSYDHAKELFISGGAGTGKSHLLRAIVAVCNMLEIPIQVLAHQGIAALNVDGRTISSFFQKKQEDEGGEVEKRIPIIIFDEVSMISKEVLDGTISKRLRKWHGFNDPDNTHPFGKVTIAFMGDLMQLPPVEGSVVFNSSIWIDKVRLRLLTENHRQSDTEFIENLNIIRFGFQNRPHEEVERCLQFFNQFKLTAEEEQEFGDALHIMSTNQLVNLHNREKYNKLIKPDRIFYTSKWIEERTESNNTFKNIRSREDVDKQLPSGVPLCKGCVVMITMNHPTGKYANGDIGTVTGISIDKETDQRVINILLQRTRQRITVSHVSIECWDDSNSAESRKREIIKMCGYPIVHGWAITIHKSQGLTLDKVVINPAKIFASAQAYVALSRAKTTQGLRLMSTLQRHHIKCDTKSIVEYSRLLTENENGGNTDVTEGSQCDISSNSDSNGCGDDDDTDVFGLNDVNLIHRDLVHV